MEEGAKGPSMELPQVEIEIEDDEDDEDDYVDDMPGT